MNKRAKQRLIGVTILIFVAVGALILFSDFSGGTATKTSVAQALTEADLVGTQVEVSGEVVAGSWTSGATPFVFEIEDGEDPDSGRLRIVWNEVVPGSFGDGTTATVTGVLEEDGSINAKYLVTKCPSKYESATGALTVNDTLARADELSGVTFKVTGFVVNGSIGAPGATPRFRLADDAVGDNALDVSWGGGLSDEFADGVKVVITGSLEEGDVFECTEVALDQAAK
ncbi:MAG: cytochrome c maturation protein CcmE [Coriobacteriia bacterium]|nr:cytochrome c maturation protein CcmE [Coriobacteriia bacterium]